MSHESDGDLSRRDVLKRVALAGMMGSLASRRLVPALGAESNIPAWHEEVCAFLQSLARPDGGYAWADQAMSHLSATFATAACYQILKQPLPNAKACAAYIRTHHPRELKNLEQEHRDFDYQQIQALVWLGEDVQEFADRVLSWGAPVSYLPQYERHRYPIFRFQLAAITCRQLLGVPVAEIPTAFISYLDSRRRANGSFNNTRADDGSDGHVLNTCWGLESLQILGRAQERRDETVQWIQNCQSTDGGFRRQPHPGYGTTSDVAYTWGAIRSLALLNAQPLDRDACLRYLFSLRNPAGGFGDRPGWESNAVATHYALESLSELHALHESPSVPIRKTHAKPSLPDDLKVFTIQIEAHGTGSPTEAVDLARALKIDLWGAKNASRAWLTKAQQIAREQNVPVTFFAANEEYGTWIDLPGFGTYSHLCDMIAPADSQAGPSLAGPTAVSWDEFLRRRLEPLQAGQGRLMFQFGENEELVRALLDDSIERGGYAAISTFHFGNPDFTNSEPFLNRYRRQIPFIALQDAHGPEPWWFAGTTTGFRTLFLAKQPTWAEWLTALQNNWTVPVRRDAVSRNELWMHSGSDQVAEFVLARDEHWRWWDNPRIERPMVSIVCVRPDDEFEFGRPERGVAIRVRCAWHNTVQGQPKSPITELKELRVDGEQVEPVLFTPRSRRGPQLGDHAWVHNLPDLASGEHTARVTVVSLEDSREHSREIRFHV